MRLIKIRHLTYNFKRSNLKNLIVNYNYAWIVVIDEINLKLLNLFLLIKFWSFMKIHEILHNFEAKLNEFNFVLHCVMWMYAIACFINMIWLCCYFQNYPFTITLVVIDNVTLIRLFKISKLWCRVFRKKWIF